MLTSRQPPAIFRRPPPLVFGGGPSDERGEPATDKNQTSPDPRPSRRVLVVEDNLDSVHSLVMLLRHEGHEVEYAINGYVAIEIARRFQPEVILLDLGLPGLNGFEVCARLKAQPGLERIRIIAVTGYGSEEYRAKSRAAGCDLHIAKPYDVQHLLAVVRHL